MTACAFAGGGFSASGFRKIVTQRRNANGKVIGYLGFTVCVGESFFAGSAGKIFNVAKLCAGCTFGSDFFKGVDMPNFRGDYVVAFKTDLRRSFRSGRAGDMRREVTVLGATACGTGVGVTCFVHIAPLGVPIVVSQFTICGFADITRRVITAGRNSAGAFRFCVGIGASFIDANTIMPSVLGDPF